MKLNNSIYLSMLLFMSQTLPSAIADVVEYQDPPPINEASFVLQKFGTTMFMVAFCVLVLFGVLMLYKKYFSKNIRSYENQNHEMTLESPKNLNQALTNFYERTKTIQK